VSRVAAKTLASVLSQRRLMCSTCEPERWDILTYLTQHYPGTLADLLM